MPPNRPTQCVNQVRGDPVHRGAFSKHRGLCKACSHKLSVASGQRGGLASSGNTTSDTEHEASPKDGIKNQSEHSDCSDRAMLPLKLGQFVYRLVKGVPTRHAVQRRSDGRFMQPGGCFMAPGMLCAVCLANQNWTTPLTPNNHGCSKCHKIFDSKHWSKDVLKHHR